MDALWILLCGVYLLSLSGIGFCMGSMDPYIIKVFLKSLYPWEKVIVADIIWLDLEFC